MSSMAKVIVAHHLGFFFWRWHMLPLCAIFFISSVYSRWKRNNYSTQTHLTQTHGAYFGRGAKSCCEQQHTYENENAKNVGANNHYALLGLPIQSRLHNPISNTRPTCKSYTHKGPCICTLLIFDLQTWWIH
jgi:hypothetical protein